MTYEKTDRNGLLRDTSTGAIINNDLTALEAYKKKKRQLKDLEEMKEKQSSMENDISEIKSMLLQIMGNLPHVK